MKYNFYRFLLFFIFISCNNKIEKCKFSNIHDINKDTIKMPKNINIAGASCLNHAKGFKNKYGIVFSNYYKDNSFNIDFDGNKRLETITVLKPYYEDNLYECYPQNSESDFPILVISKTIENKSKLFKIFKNALTINTVNYFEEVNSNRNGFVISKNYNGNNGFFSKTYISFSSHDFYVDSINVESWGEHQYNKKIYFKSKPFKLSKYKRTDIDSIRNVFDSQK